MVEREETCLKINGKQTVKLKSGSIKFKNCFKQLVVSFNIYADFESFLKGVRSSNKILMLHSLKNIKKKTFLLTNLFVLVINLAKIVVF